MTVKPN